MLSFCSLSNFPLPLVLPKDGWLAFPPPHSTLQLLQVFEAQLFEPSDGELDSLNSHLSLEFSISPPIIDPRWQKEDSQEGNDDYRRVKKGKRENGLEDWLFLTHNPAPLGIYEELKSFDSHSTSMIVQACRPEFSMLRTSRANCEVPAAAAAAQQRL